METFYKVSISILVLASILIAGCKKEFKESPLIDASFEAQVLAPEVISTSDFHESINYFDAKNNVLYFTRSDREFKTSVIYTSKYSSGIWSLPAKLPFCDNLYDAGFILSPQRDVVFFTSKRDPGVTGLSEEWNIWHVNHGYGRWGAPEVLSPPVNSEFSECCLVMNVMGKSFFSSNRDGSWDIYEADFIENEFINIQKLGDSVNSTFGEWPGDINERGDILIFSSIRKTGIGGDDLYVTKNAGGVWTKPTLLDSTINSTSYEDNPFLLHAEEVLLFSSWRDTEFSEQMSNIYKIKLDHSLESIFSLE